LQPEPDKYRSAHFLHEFSNFFIIIFDAEHIFFSYKKTLEFYRSDIDKAAKGIPQIPGTDLLLGHGLECMVHQGVLTLKNVLKI